MTVEVCPICDIAGCRHIRERKSAGVEMTLQEAIAEVARLREALRDIIDTGGRFGTVSHMENVDRIARAALKPAGDTP